jgi:hypothetical protein
MREESRLGIVNRKKIFIAPHMVLCMTNRGKERAVHPRADFGSITLLLREIASEFIPETCHLAVFFNFFRRKKLILSQKKWQHNIFFHYKVLVKLVFDEDKVLM